MKKLKTNIDFYIALWHTFPTWLKTILIIVVLIIMGQNGIFSKPY
jgi:hypothetical protein